MDRSDKTLKQLSFISLAAMAVWMLGGIVFYKERLLFVDSAYIVFKIIKDKHLFIQEHRYGSFITQMIPLLGAQLHLPIRYILLAYTFSFGCFYLIAGLIVYKCRQYALVVLMALYYFLLVSDSWFWTNNEIQQAVAWMFICYGVTLYMGERHVKLYWLLPVFVVLSFLTVYTHFIVLIPFLFLWVFMWVSKDRWPFSKGVSIVLSTIIGLIVVSKFLVVKTSSYDDNHLYNVTHLSIKDVILAFNSGSVRKFVMRSFSEYWLIYLIFPAGLLAAWKAGRKVPAIWSLVAFMGYICLMGITYSQGDILKFHIESEWQSLSVIICAAFVFYFLPVIDIRRSMLLLSAIFLIRTGYIVAARDSFTWRIAFTNEVLLNMKKKGITKLALANDGYLKKKYILDWGVPYESMLISAMQQDEPQRTFTFIDTNDIVLKDQLRCSKNMYASFDVIDPQHWNYEYYRPDTSHPYTIMTYQELFR